MDDAAIKVMEEKSFFRLASHFGKDPEELAKIRLISLLHQYKVNCELEGTPFSISSFEENVDIQIQPPYVMALIEADRRANKRWGEKICKELARIFPNLYDYLPINIDELKKKAGMNNVDVSIDTWLQDYLNSIPMITLYGIEDLDIYFRNLPGKPPIIAFSNLLNNIIQLLIAPVVGNMICMKNWEGKFSLHLDFESPLISDFVDSILYLTDIHLELARGDKQLKQIRNRLLDWNPFSSILFFGMKEFILFHEYAHFAFSHNEKNVCFEDELDVDIMAANVFVHNCLDDPNLSGEEFRAVKVAKLSAPLFLLLYLSVIQGKFGFRCPESHPSPLARFMYILHIIGNALMDFKKESRAVSLLGMYGLHLFSKVYKTMGFIESDLNEAISPKDVLDDYPMFCFPPEKLPLVFSLAKPGDESSKIRKKSDEYIIHVLKRKKKKMKPGEKIEFGILNKSVVHEYFADFLTLSSKRIEI